MHDKLAKLIASKKDKLSDSEKNAKMSVVKDMHDLASGMMHDKLKGLQKVTVASDDPEGLKAGLEHAHDIVDQHEHMDGDEGNSEDMEEPAEREDGSLEGEDKEEGEAQAYEGKETPEEEAEEEEEREEHMSPEEIHAKIAELQAKLLKHKA